MYNIKGYRITTPHFTIQDITHVRNVTKRIKKIKDATYKKDNLKKIVNKFKYLSDDKQSLILKLLPKHKEIFDGKFGNYTGAEYKFELLEEPNYTMKNALCWDRS